MELIEIDVNDYTAKNPSIKPTPGHIAWNYDPASERLTVIHNGHHMDMLKIQFAEGKNLWSGNYTQMITGDIESGQIGEAGFTIGLSNHSNLPDEVRQYLESLRYDQQERIRESATSSPQVKYEHVLSPDAEPDENQGVPLVLLPRSGTCLVGDKGIHHSDLMKAYTTRETGIPWDTPSALERQRRLIFYADTFLDGDHYSEIGEYNPKNGALDFGQGDKRWFGMWEQIIKHFTGQDVFHLSRASIPSTPSIRDHAPLSHIGSYKKEAAGIRVRHIDNTTLEVNVDRIPALYDRQEKILRYGNRGNGHSSLYEDAGVYWLTAPSEQELSAALDRYVWLAYWPEKDFLDDEDDQGLLDEVVRNEIHDIMRELSMNKQAAGDGHYGEDYFIMGSFVYHKGKLYYDDQNFHTGIIDANPNLVDQWFIPVNGSVWGQLFGTEDGKHIWAEFVSDQIHLTHDYEINEEEVGLALSRHVAGNPVEIDGQVYQASRSASLRKQAFRVEYKNFHELQPDFADLTHDAWIYDKNADVLYFLGGGHHINIIAQIPEWHEGLLGVWDNTANYYAGDIEHGDISMTQGGLSQLPQYVQDELRRLEEAHRSRYDKEASVGRLRTATGALEYAQVEPHAPNVLDRWQGQPVMYLPHKNLVLYGPWGLHHDDLMREWSTQKAGLDIPPAIKEYNNIGDHMTDHNKYQQAYIEYFMNGTPEATEIDKDGFMPIPYYSTNREVWEDIEKNVPRLPTPFKAYNELKKQTSKSIYEQVRWIEGRELLA